MLLVTRKLFAVCLALVGGPLSAAADVDPRLAEIAAAIGPAPARAAISGISSLAAARGPRGAFTSEMIALADGTARFRLIKPEGDTSLLLTAGQIYRSDSASAPVKTADAAMASFLRGHEVHRMLLDLDHRFRLDARAAPAGCLPLRGPDGLAVTICGAEGSELPGSIELELPAALGGGNVTIELADWRILQGAPGVQLPFTANFLHAGERHSYRFTEVLPFRFAPGAPGVPGPPAAGSPASKEVAAEQVFARLGDLAALVAAHERLLDAHRRSDPRLLLAGAAERSLESRRGRLQETGREELAARLGPYLASVHFSRYDDVVVPAVAVSADGTLGWLACQIEAAGTTVGSDAAAEPIAYGFSWVELYAKEHGRWQNIGNASSARP